MSRGNPLTRSWLYLSAWFDAQIDERADPKVQLEQAINQAQSQHQSLAAQAAVVLGSEHQLITQLARQRGRVADLAPQARQALTLADSARAEGDDVRAEQFESAAQAAAEQLISAEASVEELTKLAEQATVASAQARRAVTLNSSMLREKIAERMQLLAKLEHAKMQEQVATSMSRLAGFAEPGNVPTLDEVRDKIEQRYAVALGRAELARDEGTPLLLEVQRAAAQARASARVAEIRAAMTAEAGDASAAGDGVEAGPLGG